MSQRKPRPIDHDNRVSMRGDCTIDGHDYSDHREEPQSFDHRARVYFYCLAFLHLPEAYEIMLEKREG